MPDIISRIRVQAEGADQAAREIRKLKEAYSEVSQAARNLSPSSVGSADPFSRATTAPGGGITGGQRSQGEILEREQRNDFYQRQQRQREGENRAYGGGFGTRFPSTVSNAMNMAQTAGSGQYGSAAGQGASMLGGLLGGGLGIGLMAAGAIGMGVQKFGNTEYERVQRLWGGGVSQRLGLGYQTVRDWEINMGRRGISEQNITSFINTASQSGFDIEGSGKGASSRAASIALEAATRLGSSSAASAGLLGAMSQAGMDVGSADYGVYQIAQGTFGRQQVDRFIQTLTQGISGAIELGIRPQTAALDRQTNLMGGLSSIGGLTAAGAANLTSTVLQRSRSAATLSRPEDIIAFQAMRNPGESITETQMRMEANPLLTSRGVFQHLRQQTGGNRDALIHRVRSFLGEGTSVTQAAAFVDTMTETQGMDSDEIQAFLESRASAWLPEGEGEGITREREITAVRQSKLFQRLEESALNLTTELGKLVRDGLVFDARDVSFGDGVNFGPIENDEMDVHTRNLVIHAPTEASSRVLGLPSGDHNMADLRDILSTRPEGALDYDEAYDIHASRIIDRAREIARSSGDPNKSVKVRGIASEYGPEQIYAATGEMQVNILLDLLNELKNVGVNVEVGVITDEGIDSK